MKNVIDMTLRLKTQGKSKGQKASAPAEVLDMTERRQEILQNERREVRRTILSEFVGAFTVVPNKGLFRVTMYDISENGLAFDVDLAQGQFQVGSEIAMRVYLNQQTYFGFIVKIQNARIIQDEGVFRHGVSFVKDTINDQALYHFVKFIETVSASLQRDDGDVMVSNLSR